MTLSEIPLSGLIVGDEHHLPVRIYYEDTDFSGVVYHANYLKFFERGRSDYMRLIGVHHYELARREAPLAFAVAHMDIRFAAPVRIDEVIIIKSRLIHMSGASFTLEQSAERNAQLCTSATVQVACIDLKGRPKRLPKDLSEAIKSHLAS
ncbi:MAG: tol-pal system-associated acyl-CoA thioesterase [Asticcacaulis sp.]